MYALVIFHNDLSEPVEILRSWWARISQNLHGKLLKAAYPSRPSGKHALTGVHRRIQPVTTEVGPGVKQPDLLDPPRKPTQGTGVRDE
jgi:hypothetical protein